MEQDRHEIQEQIASIEEDEVRLNEAERKRLRERIARAEREREAVERERRETREDIASIDEASILSRTPTEEAAELGGGACFAFR